MYWSRYNKTFRAGDGVVLYNTLSGAIDIVEGDISPSVPMELESYLSQRGYLFADTAAEERELDRLSAAYSRYKDEVRPLIFHLVLTYLCNLDCRYCFQAPVKDRTASMKMEDLDGVFGAIAEIRRLFPGTKTKPVVALFGGEPLMRKHVEVVACILERTALAGYLNGPVISNGVDLDAFLPDFERRRPSGIQITLDGLRGTHDRRRPQAGGKGTFDRIVAHVQQALDLRIKIGIRTNVDQENVDELPALARFLEERGWVGHEKVELTLCPIHHRACGSFDQSGTHDRLLAAVLSLMARHPLLRNWHLDGWTVVDHFRRLLDEAKPLAPRFEHCEAAVGKSFHLDAYGMLYTCIEACGIPELAAGRFRPKLEFFPFYETLKGRNIMNMAACRPCPYALICGGGCALQSWYDHGSLAAPHCGGSAQAVEQYVAFRFGNGRKGAHAAG
jgi:uncharacterized protein